MRPKLKLQRCTFFLGKTSPYEKDVIYFISKARNNVNFVPTINLIKLFNLFAKVPCCLCIVYKIGLVGHGNYKYIEIENITRAAHQITIHSLKHRIDQSSDHGQVLLSLFSSFAQVITGN